MLGNEPSYLRGPPREALGELGQVRRSAGLLAGPVLGLDQVQIDGVRGAQLGEGLEVGLDLGVPAVLPLPLQVQFDQLDQGGQPE